MVKKSDFIVMGGSVLGGMIASEIIAQELAKLIPVDIPHIADMLQLGGGLGLILALGSHKNIIGKVGVYGGIGSIASGVLGMLNIKIPYLAQAGGPQPVELTPYDLPTGIKPPNLTDANNINIFNKADYQGF